MRLYLRPEERRPDPAPVQTDDRKALGVGLGLWALALVAALIGIVPVDSETMLWTCLTGIAIGIAGMIYTVVRSRRRR